MEAKRQPKLAIQLISSNSGNKVRSSFDELQALRRRGVASRGYILLVYPPQETLHGSTGVLVPPANSALLSTLDVWSKIAILTGWWRLWSKGKTWWRFRPRTLASYSSQSNPGRALHQFVLEKDTAGLQFSIQITIGAAKVDKDTTEAREDWRSVPAAGVPSSMNAHGVRLLLRLGCSRAASPRRPPSPPPRL